MGSIALWEGFIVLQKEDMTQYQGFCGLPTGIYDTLNGQYSTIGGVLLHNCRSLWHFKRGIDTIYLGFYGLPLGLYSPING